MVIKWYWKVFEKCWLFFFGQSCCNSSNLILDPGLINQNFWLSRWIGIYLVQEYAGAAARYFKWSGHIILCLRRRHHGWRQRARKFCEFEPSRLAKTASFFEKDIFENYYEITKTNYYVILSLSLNSLPVSQLKIVHSETQERWKCPRYLEFGRSNLLKIKTWWKPSVSQYKCINNPTFFKSRQLLFFEGFSNMVTDEAKWFKIPVKKNMTVII